MIWRTHQQMDLDLQEAMEVKEKNGSNDQLPRRNVPVGLSVPSSEIIRMEGFGDQLNHLTDQLTRGESIRQILPVVCMGGIGKTTLAKSVSTCLDNRTDFEALAAFKGAISSDPFGALDSWNETVHFCSWQGIICGRRHPDRVVEINLRSQSLVGSISPYLGNLSFLRSIILQNNSFYGPIPDEIGRLRRLAWLDLSNNSLSGQIPRNLSHCVDIYYLNLIDNQLIGPVPSELRSLLNLQGLGLGSNPLSGTIPSYIGNFTSLQSLSFEECEIQGEIPESLGQLKSLSFLNLASNNLTGKVPAGLYNISTITYFVTYSNRLRGIIPSHISFSSAEYIDMGYNGFSGQIPNTLSNFSALNHLLLDENSFAGRMTVDFTRLCVLRVLQVSINKLQGGLGFLSALTNCSSSEITTIDLSRNQLTGLLPNFIGNFSGQISALLLSGNQFCGTIPTSIINLRSLTMLFLGSNLLDGPIPSALGSLTNLHVLVLDDNRFNSSIPFSLGNLSLLNILYLNQNNLSGSIPHSLGNCTNLLQLDISLNSLTGPIPPEVMLLSSISIILNLSHNGLTGPVPSEVGSLMHLIYLDMSHNRLSGFLPSTLGGCVGLETIYLQSNSFSGGLPNELKNLKSLQYLDLSQNNLSGIVPKFLGEMDLQQLDLSFNRLEGEIPTVGVFLNMSAVSLEGNGNLCGGIPSLGFPHCPSTEKKGNGIPTVFKILIPVVISGAVVIACYYMFMYRCRKMKAQVSMLQLEADYMRLSYADLQKSTGGFSQSNLLGAGRFGSVYKGILDDRQTSLAVKVLNLNVMGASKSFVSECNALRGIRHRNLVKIVSACSSIDFHGNDFKALVYEFMANGNLDEWLHPVSEVGSKSLSLRQRLTIAGDVASALEYMHFGTYSTIVHGDLKPSNVLLDGEMTAHVGDFGLAKIISNNLEYRNESSSVEIRGTLGYIPPEYGMSGMVSTEGDVYSFGILLLEIFTGRRPTDDEFNDSSSLRDLTASALPSQVMEILDPIILRLKQKNDLKSIAYGKQFIELAEISEAGEKPNASFAVAGVYLYFVLRFSHMLGQRNRF